MDREIEIFANNKMVFTLMQDEISELNKYLVQNGISVNALDSNPLAGRLFPEYYR